MTARAFACGVLGQLLAASLAAHAATYHIATEAELRSALAAALPGDVVVIAPGDYTFTANLICDRPGAAGAPITVMAEVPGCARLHMDTVEGFKVSAPYWTFTGLDIEGICADHSNCEHAFHVFGDADFFTLRGSRLHDFNAMIKGNGFDYGAGRVFPDDVLIEGNEFFDATPRATGNPVTPIDVVGGRRWVVRQNFIHDYQKKDPLDPTNNVSYAAFLKGNSRNGLFEGNIVACHLDGTDAGGARVGLSFGGGGSSPDPICEDGTCTPEHQDGILRDNLIVNCSDVGVYLNEAWNCQVHGNTLYDTSGIDVRFVASVVDLRDNLVSGLIRIRDGGTMTVGSNIDQIGNGPFQSWFKNPARYDFALVGDGSSFVDKGEVVAALAGDFCGGARDATPDIGAVEYDADVCDTTAVLPLLVPPPPVPATSPGNSLRVVKAPSQVRLTWTAGSGEYDNLYRDTDPRATGTTLYAARLSTVVYDEDPVALTAAVYAWRVRAVAPCTGVEAE